MLKNTLRYFDYRFYLRFAGLFLALYFSYLFVVAAVAPSGFYFPFVEKYLNFPVPIRSAVLYTSQFFLSLLNYQTTLVGDQLRSADGYSILAMAWACLGIGVKSFWIAFVCAHRLPIRQKVNWVVLGVVTIFFVNCIRVVIMMIAMVEKWSIAEYLGTNAHELFNYLSYAVLLLLVLYFYSKTGSGKEDAAVRQKKSLFATPALKG